MSQRNKLFVGGLSQNVTQDTLYETFDKYGKIEDGESDSFCIFCSFLVLLKLLCIFVRCSLVELNMRCKILVICFQLCGR